jgi:hypothetical protein
MLGKRGIEGGSGKDQELRLIVESSDEVHGG